MGTRGLGEFSTTTQKIALARQENVCASCGEIISARGAAHQETHFFGEAAEAHHISPLGTKRSDSGRLKASRVENCVVICKACHYCAHGGNYRSRIRATVADFPYYNGPKRRR
ncbi:MAG TPA: hypothetical protein VF699_13815 [Caulobacteraceae bacterium]|jgi:succinate dehydrogenase/fumarate reductase-like Fe-S protein